MNHVNYRLETVMDKIKKVTVTILATVICMCSLSACNSAKRGPLDIKKVTYVVCPGGLNLVYVYVFTPDLKMSEYSFSLDTANYRDYLNGELPPEEYCVIDAQEIPEMNWTSIENIFTRVDIMNLKEDMSSKQKIDDGSSYYISVETSDGIHMTGGYMAGKDDDSDSRRFAEARGVLDDTLVQATK